MNAYLGHLAALGTSLAWSIVSICFTLAGQRVGSPNVNRSRLLLGVIFTMITHAVMVGGLIPLHAEPYRWGWLAISGLIGYVLGDASLFQAFVLIGPRVSMLVMTLAPVMNTIMGWVLFKEHLTPMELIGIALAVGGVGLVVTEARNGNSSGSDNPGDEIDGEKRRKQFATGLLFAFGGALGQSTGLLFSRLGVEGDFSALSGNLIRLLVGAVIIWTWAAIRGDAVKGIVEFAHEPKALLFLTLGSIGGPFLGVWLSLVAVQKAPLGIASTLMSLSPVLLLPAGYLVFKERFGVQAVVGTIVAVGGTALLFL